MRSRSVPLELRDRLEKRADQEEWANSTFNHYRTLMLMTYREAHRNEKISVTSNPAKHVPRRHEDNNRVRQLTLDEEKALRKVIRRKYRWHEPELDFSLHTGLRQGNQYRLEWSLVDLDRRMVHIPRAKNEQPLHVALNRLAVEALEKVRRRGGATGRVFERRVPASRFEAHALGLRAMKDAKIVGFRWHDLRHTAASRLRQKGAKLEDIAEFLGHKSLMMTKIYAHLGPTGLQDIVALLEQRPTGSGSRIRTGPKTAPSNLGRAEVPVKCQ